MLTDNINTDQIIPSREMKNVAKTGLANGLFANLRYVDAASGGRTPNADFVLNQTHTKNASVLIAASNFGCGSSREHAVWALREYGFRVIIAQSFGSIFYDNCINNGIIPVTLKKKGIAQLSDAVAVDNTAVDVDLERCTITVGDLSIEFYLNEDKRQMLITGNNAIDLTLTRKTDIDHFLKEDKNNRPWIYELVDASRQPNLTSTTAKPTKAAKVIEAAKATITTTGLNPQRDPNL